MKFWNEAQIFFIYDTKSCASEEDDPRDAILYFHPLEISESFRCAFCCQLMGMYQFFTASFSEPAFVYLKNNKFSVLNVGHYMLFLGGKLEMPDNVLKGQLNTLYQLFQFYHKSIKDFRQNVDSTKSDFLNDMAILWQYYLPVSQRYGNTVSLTFDVLPSLGLSKAGGNIFRRASQILNSCQSQPGVLAGCILIENQLLCSRLPPEIIKYLYFISSDNTEFPAQDSACCNPLPAGVKIVYIYLMQDTLQKIKDFNKDKQLQENTATTNDFMTQTSGINGDASSAISSSCHCSDIKKNESGNECNNEMSSKSVIRNCKTNAQRYCLYIQGHSKTQLFLITEESMSQCPEVIDFVWKTGLSNLVDLEMDIKSLGDSLPKQVSSNNYIYLQYDHMWKSLKAEKPVPTYPTELSEQLFNRTVQIVHDTVIKDPSIQESSLIFGDSVLYCHKLSSLETYYQEMLPVSLDYSLQTVTNAISNIPSSARRTLSKDQGLTLL